MKNEMKKGILMPYDDQELLPAVAALRAGKPAIFPTETVYGIGVAVGYAQTPQILYDLKQRDREKPVAWLVDGPSALLDYGKAVPDFALALAREFWPGPLTLIVKASDRVPAVFCSHEGTIGLRMPDSQTARELIARVGAPLATTSANFSGSESPQTFAAIDGALLSRVDAAIEDDVEKSGVASTVIDCTKKDPLMVRQGAISLADVRALL